MVLTQFSSSHNFCSFLSLPATPCKFFVLNPRKRLHFRGKFGGFELVLGKEMCALKFLELIRKGKEGHGVCCCCCGEGSLSEADRKLEAEILAFMEKSQNPVAFPTRKDLEKAGRVDLIEAIRSRGGWYSFGWDSEEEPTEAEEMDFDIEELRRRVVKYQESDSGSDFSFGDSSQPASSSGRSL